MRLKLLTNLNTLLLVAVCVALGATLWWSQKALERPYLLMERYLGLSQQFQNEVARNVEDYLASGDALRLSSASQAIDALQKELVELPPALADTLRPSLTNLDEFSKTDLLAAGKLAGDPQALLLQAERELGAHGRQRGGGRVGGILVVQQGAVRRARAGRQRAQAAAGKAQL